MSTPTYRYLVNPRALLGYSSLTRTDRAALDAALAALVDLPEPQWRSAGAIRLDSPESLYMLRVDESLRAIVMPGAGGQPELLDLVRHELLERYFKGAG